MGTTNPLRTDETIALHLFGTDNGGIDRCFRADNGARVNGIRTDKHLFHVGDDPRKVIDAILKPIGPRQRIRTIRVLAHGDAGGMLFPGLINVNLVTPEWKRLIKCFEGRAKVELHGCGVASETSILRPGTSAMNPKFEDIVPGTFTGKSTGRGLIFMRKVVATLGLQVTAGIDYQISTSNDWTFEHDTVTVLPEGKFRYDSNETRGMDAEALNKAAKIELDLIEKDLIKKNKRHEAELHLRELVRNYPNTSAAKKARTLLANNLTMPQLQPMAADPD